MYFVYLIQSAKTNRYYIGCTSDIKKRLQYHNEGLNTSTKNRGPWALKYKEQFEYKTDALKRERFLKKQRNHRFYEKLISGCGAIG